MFATFPSKIVLLRHFIRTATNSLNSAIFSDVYHFRSGMAGLAYIGLGMGYVIATVFGAKLCDKIYIYVGQGYLLILTTSAEACLHTACCKEWRSG